MSAQGDKINIHSALVEVQDILYDIQEIIGRISTSDLRDMERIASIICSIDAALVTADQVLSVAVEHDWWR